MSLPVLQIVHLDNILNIFLAYPTHVDIMVVTDAPASVRRMLQGLGTVGVDVWWHFNASAYDGQRYNLLYEHRHVMRHAAKAGDSSARPPSTMLPAVVSAMHQPNPHNKLNHHALPGN